MTLLIQTIYPNLYSLSLQSAEELRRYFAERIILCPRNADVDKINEVILRQLPGELQEYLSSDVALKDGGATDYNVPVEYLNTINLAGAPLHHTVLKIGCPIILLRNLDPSSGLCNGTRLVVTKTALRVIEARILTGSHTGDIVLIPRISLDSSRSARLPFTLRRRQFPVRLAFAMTINKSQGQSVPTVGLYLREPVFVHG